jgi:magnesium transporter
VRLLAYDEDSAGGLMQTELVAIPADGTAASVVRHLRARATEYADYPASYLYVVDASRRLEGVVSVRGLLLCDEDTPVRTITSTGVLSVQPTMPATELVTLFEEYHYLAIPVVDDRGRLLGVVTQDDALRFSREEREEELLSMSGIVGGEEFRDMPLGRRSWRRLSWLSVNILLNIAAASVIAFHQETVQAVIALAVFLPIISDMSGCSGNQAVAVSIRELALDRLRPKDFLHVVVKELSVGVINGLALGVLLGAAAWLWKGNLVLGLVIGVALWANTLLAVVVGGLVPLMLRAARQDPALASGPILTTITDMSGFLVTLTLASRLLHHLT